MTLAEALVAALPLEVLVVDAGGCCPVQVMLDLPDGSRLYFRARDAVSVEVWGPGWSGDGLPDGDPDYSAEPIPWRGGAYAGYMPDADVVRLVVEHVRLYQRATRALARGPAEEATEPFLLDDDFDFAYLPPHRR